MTRLDRGIQGFIGAVSEISFNVLPALAYRLSTVVNAHRIVVLKDGRILESGSHEDLVAAGGYYASLVQRLAHVLPGPSGASATVADDHGGMRKGGGRKC